MEKFVLFQGICVCLQLLITCISSSILLDEKLTLSLHTEIEEENVVFVLKGGSKEAKELWEQGFPDKRVIFKRVSQIDAQRDGYNYVYK